MNIIKAWPLRPENPKAPPIILYLKSKFIVGAAVIKSDEIVLPEVEKLFGMDLNILSPALKGAVATSYLKLSPLKTYNVILLGGNASDEKSNVTADASLWFIVTELLLYGEEVCWTISPSVLLKELPT